MAGDTKPTVPAKAKKGPEEAEASGVTEATVAAKLRAAAEAGKVTVSAKDAKEPEGPEPRDAYLPTLGANEPVSELAPEADAEELLAEVRRPLEERFEECGTIGSGGMGTIEMVLDRALRRRIAKKAIHPRLSERERALFLFVREARITSQLDHPNIVPVHHLGEDDEGKLYFTMKRVEGRPLSEVLSELPKGALQRSDLVNVLTMLIKVCDALTFAHSKGVLHCDIKPSNIMVGSYGEVYLMDWGIARVVDSSVSDIGPLDGIRETSVGLSSGAAMGTPSYMSPEQAAGQRDRLDERADVFAMGAILYRVLAGRPPYSGDSHTVVLGQAQAGVWDVPAKIRNAAVPLELQRITMRAMQRNRDDRYRSITALRDDLQNYLYVGGDFPSATFEPGEHIIHEGDQGYSVYIMERGHCRAYRTVDGKEIDLAILGPGDVFGETAILASVSRTASVVAIDKTSVYVVTREVLENELSDVKPWLARLVRALAERFRDERARLDAVQQDMSLDDTAG